MQPRQLSGLFFEHLRNYAKRFNMLKSHTPMRYKISVLTVTYLLWNLILSTALAPDLLAGSKKSPKSFDPATAPAATDYSNPEHWSALPFRWDEADVLPKGETWISDSLKSADVFYIYPTIYTKGENWNADVENDKLNKKIDTKPVHFQASVFNESCRVYAPRYRQSHVAVFFEDSSADGTKALDLAYADVKAAFEYYLKHYNNGRPIIIAGHSQGSWHTRKLLQEYFDTTALKSQLVAGYIIGYTIREDMYESLSLCKGPDETGCFVSWMSYKEGHQPKWEAAKNTSSVNPITWTTDQAKVAASKNAGTVVLNLQKIKPGESSAQVLAWKDGTILYVKTKSNLLRLLGNLHIADYNLFYQDIRSNVKNRLNVYLGVSQP
jgi:hypothetical protein